MVVGSAILLGLTLYAMYKVDKAGETINTKLDYKDLKKSLQKTIGSDNNKDLEYYLRDAMFEGVIDGNAYKNTLAAFTKLKNYNYDYKKLSTEDLKSINNLYSTLYNSDYKFKKAIDDEYINLTDEEKLAFLKGTGTSGVPIPAPAYLDTSFDNYQREVEPVKHYTNKELAELYNIDYDFDSIKRDYDAAAEAGVTYSDWISNLLANRAERNNVTDTTSYLDAIRNIKSEAVQKGISNGARAAADLLANKTAMQNKALNNVDVAQQRFETMNDSLLNRAQTELTTFDIYDDLANRLATAGTTLYANDINRKGQDLLTNANILSADENLRSNRMAQNNLMAAMYANAKAQNLSYADAINQPINYFKDITLPANNYDFNAAINDYISKAYSQNTGYSDPMAKWGSAVNK